MILALLLACAGGSWMRAAPDAGFDLGPVQSALWFDYGDGMGAVMLSTGALDCSAFGALDFEEGVSTAVVVYWPGHDRWAGDYYLGLTGVPDAPLDEDSPYLNRFTAGVVIGETTASAYGYGEATLDEVTDVAVGEAHTELFDVRFRATVCASAEPECSDPTTEVCNGVDDDCDGEIDEGVTIQVYRDYDGDGWGAGDGGERCQVPEGYATGEGDCDDGDGTVYPGAEELCDGRDHDCDGTLDDECP